MSACDHCGEEMREAAAILHVFARSSRFCVVRAWGFCGETCCDEWVAAPKAEDFHAPLSEEDEPVTLEVRRYRAEKAKHPEARRRVSALSGKAHHPSGPALNAWWRLREEPAGREG